MLASVFWLLRRPAQPLVVLALALGAFAVGERAAAAHVIFLESEPAAGAAVDELRDVRLVFVGEIAEDGHSLVLATADGREVAAAVERAEPTTLVARFDGDVPAGDHQIRWEVVALDGDRQRGSIPITVATDQAPTADADEGLPTPPSPDPQAGTAQRATAQPATSVPAAGDEAGWVTGVLVLLVLLVLLGGAALYRRRWARPASR